MANETKKILVPKDKNGNGKLGNDFTAANANYENLPDVQRAGMDDLPYNAQPIVDNVEAASISSIQDKVKADTQINSRQPGDINSLESSTQFLPGSRRPGTIDRPSQTATLGQFLKQGRPGRRIQNSDQIGIDHNGNEVSRKLGGDILRDINTQTQGRFSTSPHGRPVAGTPGPAYGTPEVQSGAGPVVKSSVSAVLGMNRFAAIGEKSFATAETNPDKQVVGSFQPEVGSYNPNTGDDPTQFGQSFNIEKLKSIGIDMLRAAAGIHEENAVNKDVQMGRSSLSADSLRPRNLSSGEINKESFDVSKASTGEFNQPEDGKPNLSYGQLNTPGSPFASLTPNEMKALSSAIIAITVEAIHSNSLVNTLVAGASNSSSHGSAPYTKGSFVEKPKNGGAFGRSAVISQSDLGFINTEIEFSLAVDAGLAILLGDNSTGIVEKFSGNLNLQNSINQAKQNIDAAPGFYVNFCRAILKDSQNLSEKFAEVGNMGTGSTEGVAAAIGIIDVFRSSKLVACINTLATIGDSASRASSSPYSIDQISPSGDIGILNDGAIGVSYNPASHAMKSRDGNKVAGGVDSLRLAWRSSSTPSMYLLPAEIEYGSVINGAKGTTPGTESPMAAHANMEGITKSDSSGRLPQEFVEKHEEILDAEYVPFYFHDLRTNEIISFHAFLESLSDGFAAQYTPSQGIGRAEPIKLYKGTTRSIGFNFIVAATSRDDFNEMWFKINKLVTMLYPQYTQGREAGNPTEIFGQPIFGQNFIMPFSQVMSASPMIRLRIGDVVKSNFSKFNLSRLFGLGTPQLDPMSAGLGVPAASLVVYRLLFQGLGIVNNLPIPGIAKTAILNSATVQSNILEASRLIKENARKLPVSNSNDAYGYKVGDIVRLGFPDIRKLKLASGNGSPELFLNYRNAFAKIVSLPIFDEQGSAKSVRYRVQLSTTFENARTGITDISGPTNTYFISHHDVSLVPGGLMKERLVIDGLRKATGKANVLYSTSVLTFLSSFQNAVVRSFEHSGGKGLPGFVKNLSFQWIGQDSTWEVDRGSRAPKFCKIQVSFDPVHDIAPGLDHTGYNRAPVYPVGDVVNNIAGKSNDWADEAVSSSGEYLDNAVSWVSNKTEDIFE